MNTKTNNNTNLSSHCILICLLIFFFIITCSSEANAQYDASAKPVPENKEGELLNELRRSHADAKRVRALLDLGNLYYNKPYRINSDLNKGLNYTIQAKQLCIQLKDVLDLGEAQVRMAEILGDQGKMEAADTILSSVVNSAKYDLLMVLSFKNCVIANDYTDHYFKNAIKFGEQARQTSITSHDKLKELLARNQLAYIHIWGNEPNVEKDFLDVLAGLKKNHYPYLHHVYLSLCYYYLEKGFFDQDLDNAQKALESVRQTRDTLSLGECYLNFAMVYRNTGKFQKSIDYYKLVINELIKHRSYFGNTVPAVVVAISNTLRRMGKPAEALVYSKNNQKAYPALNGADSARYEQELGKCYEESGKTSLAELHLLSSYNYLNKTHQVTINDNREMAQFYIEAKAFSKAKMYIDAILGQSKVAAPAQVKSLIQYMAFLVDSAAGNWKSAIGHLSKCKVLDNSYLSEKRNQEIETLNIKYETKEKQDQIKILNQNAAIEKDKLQKAILLKNITFSGIALTLIIALLLYRQSANRKKNNKIITHKNELLEHLLTEKEWLLKEVHHRVKNNLHTVICLLESQAAYLENDALDAIEICQRRIYAMSLIHQKLYQSEDIKLVDMKLYVKEFIGYLSNSFDSPPNVQIKLDIESIKLGSTQAIPLSLILNEAVTNSFKYAFPDKRQGNIYISLKKIKFDITELVIADDGIGMAKLPDDTQINSLGIKLIKGLTLDIDGTIYFDINNGTKMTIQFVMNSFDLTNFHQPKELESMDLKID